MTEVELWALVNISMGNLWHAQRHEDSISIGIPDVSFTYSGVNGWMELKCSSPSGKRPIRIPKLKPEQLNWAHNRIAHGGYCWICWQMSEKLLLIPSDHISEYDERHPSDTWEDIAKVSGGVSDLSRRGIQNALKSLLGHLRTS